MKPLITAVTQFMIIFIVSVHIQYCAKVMQTYFAKIRDFSWLFDEKISNSRWKRIFNEKSR